MKKMTWLVGVALALCMATSSFAATGSWNVNANGWWCDGGNWLGGVVPNAAGDTANFNFDITAARTVTIHLNKTAGIVNIGDASHNYIFRDNGSWKALYMNNGASGSQFNVTAGTVQFGNAMTANLNLIQVGGPLTINVTGTALTFAMALGGLDNGGFLTTITGAGNTTFDNTSDIYGAGGLTKEGTGMLTLQAVNTFTGAVNINGGTLTTSGVGVLDDAVAVTVGSAGTYTIGVADTIDTLANSGTVNVNAATTVTTSVTNSGSIVLGANLTTASYTSNGSGSITTGANTLRITAGGTATFNNATTVGNLLLVGAGTVSSTSGIVQINSFTELAGGSTFSTTSSGSKIEIGDGTGDDYTEIGLPALVKNGVGSLEFASNTIVDHVATMNGGTLILQTGTQITGLVTLNNGTIYVKDGTAVGGGLLDLTTAASTPGTVGGADITTYALGNMSGVAGIQKIGTDTVTVTGTANTKVGASSVDAGTLVMNGSMTGSAFTVNSGGTLMGSGSMSQLLNHGVVNPGNSPGTLNAGASFTQTANGVYVVEIESASNHDKIIAGGANVDGTVRPVLLSNYRPRVGTEFDIIETTGGVTGNFDNIDDAQAELGLTAKWGLRYTDNAILKVDPYFTNPDLSLNQNQRNLAVALDRDAVGSKGSFGDALFEINKLGTAEDVRAAYDILSPTRYAGLMDVSFISAELQNQSISRRMTAVRTGETPLALNMFDGTINGQMAVIGRDMGKIVAEPTIEPANDWTDKLAFFINGNGSLADQDAHGLNAAGYQSGTGAVTLGADYRVSDNVVVGLATGYSNTDYDMGLSGGEIGIDSVPVNLFGGLEIGNFFANTSVGYAASWYDSSRTIAIGSLDKVANAETTSDQINAAFEMGYDLSFGKFTVTPVAGVDYSMTWIKGFTETGAGSVGLEVKDSDQASLESALGADLSYKFQIGKMSLVPTVFARWKHEFMGDSYDINSRFQGGDTWFRTNTEDLTQDYMATGAGIGAIISDRVSANLVYRTDLFRQDYSNHLIQGGVRVSF